MTDVLELPHDVEAERIVLGSLMQAPVYLDSVALEPSEFYLKSSQLVYQTMRDLQREGHPVQFPSVCGRLRDFGELERAGGATGIAHLIDGVPGNDPSYYAERVHSKSLQRACMQAGYAIAAQAAEAESGDAAVEYAERTIARLSDGEDGGSMATAGEVANAYLEELQRTNGEAPEGILTGLRDLDDVLVTLEPQTLTIVGARPSQGKSAFGLTVALNVAEMGIPVVIFSLEMSKAQLIQRLLAMIARVDLRDLRKRNVHREDWPKLGQAQMKIERLPLLIDDTRGLNAGQVCARMRHIKNRSGLGLAIIDFLTRLRFQAKAELRHELGNAAKAFKDISGELNMPVIALSQLSRMSVTGTIRKPQLSDLRESGNLEEDSDTVIFVHRDELYHPTDENRGMAELIVAKQRQGEAPAFVQCQFSGAFVKFENLWRSR